MHLRSWCFPLTVGRQYGCGHMDYSYISISIFHYNFLNSIIKMYTFLSYFWEYKNSFIVISLYAINMIYQILCIVLLESLCSVRLCAQPWNEIPLCLSIIQTYFGRVCYEVRLWVHTRHCRLDGSFSLGVAALESTASSLCVRSYIIHHQRITMDEKLRQNKREKNPHSGVYILWQNKNISYPRWKFFLNFLDLTRTKIIAIYVLCMIG